MPKHNSSRPTTPTPPPRLPLLRPSTNQTNPTAPAPPTAHRHGQTAPINQTNTAASAPSPKVNLPPFATHQPTEKDLISLGYITRAHGLDGTVHLHLHNPQGETLFEIDFLLFKREGEKRFRKTGIRLFREHSDGFLLQLEGVNHRDQAEALRRTEIFVQRDQLPPLKDGEYYFFQLEGFPVYNTQDELLGHVLQVQEAPAQNLLVIQTAHGEAMIPIVPTLVPSIDTKARRIVIRPIPGLLPMPDDPAPSVERDP